MRAGRQESDAAGGSPSLASRPRAVSAIPQNDERIPLMSVSSMTPTTSRRLRALREIGTAEPGVLLAGGAAAGRRPAAGRAVGQAQRLVVRWSRLVE